MNTTKKGDKFEDRSFELIEKVINSGQLGLIASQCKVFRKKGYYSQKRKGNIIFDLTIEVWPPGAERFTLLCIIECKGLSHKVPVDDIEEFHNKIDQISELNTKGVFITNKGYQKGAFNIGESTGMMLIQLNYDESHQIILHKIHRSKKRKNGVKDWGDNLESILTDAFNSETRITGLGKFSTDQLEKKTKELIEEFKPDILNYFGSLPVDELIEFVAKKYKVSTDKTQSLNMNAEGHDILGYYSRNENRIYVDKSIDGTDRFPFIFAHELGHSILHRDLKMNQKVYDSFSDSQYDFKTGKHLLDNDKNWIEWQANQFASSLILPKSCLLGRLIWFQSKEGISHIGRIYVDHQRINQIDFSNTVSFLARFFGVSKTSVIYRLQQTGILTYADTSEHIGNINIFN